MSKWRRWHSLGKHDNSPSPVNWLHWLIFKLVKPIKSEIWCRDWSVNRLQPASCKCSSCLKWEIFLMPSSVRFRQSLKSSDSNVLLKVKAARPRSLMPRLDFKLRRFSRCSEVNCNRPLSVMEEQWDRSSSTRAWLARGINQSSWTCLQVAKESEVTSQFAKAPRVILTRARCAIRDFNNRSTNSVGNEQDSKLSSR